MLLFNKNSPNYFKEDTYPREYLTFSGSLFACLNRFLGYDMHIICDNYNWETGAGIEF